MTLRNFAGTTLSMALTLALGAAVLCAGCEDSSPTTPTPPTTPTTPTTTSTDSAHHDHDGHDHDGHDHGHDHGPTAPLGEAMIGGYTVKASRDGDIVAGGDAAVDVMISGGEGSPAAVRFWIGTEDGQGSMKAKGELEGEAWHTHVEVPDPLAPDSKLWVEIESASGEKSTGSFALSSH